MELDRISLIENVSDNLKVIAVLEKRINMLERDLTKGKTPLGIFDNEVWFKTDQVGMKSFCFLCDKVKKQKEKLVEVEYNLFLESRKLEEIDKLQFSKKSKKLIKNKLEELERDFE